ncbi:MAG: translation initiation factor IF-6 [Candidatus Diapherotrites archaeon]|nr:translation initiation factor IF-6 [Candidatus Diapherotrites archaeon]
MYLEQANIIGNPFVGVFSSTNDNITLLPHQASGEFESLVREVLKTKPVKTTIYNSSLIGVFCCMNNNGIVVPECIYKEEQELLSEHFDNVAVIKDYTAIGNLITCNDAGAVASPLFSDKTIKTMEKALGVDITKMKVAGIDTCGSCVIATNKGFLANPNTTKEEIKALEKIFGVPGDIGSVNYGNPFVKSGILANVNGAIIGSLATPFEIGRIDEALFFGR